MMFVYRYGPLVRSWCMRFDGKHNYFKDLAHRVKCFKNIPKTLASRHQKLVCYYSAADSNTLAKDTLIGPGMYVYRSFMLYTSIVIIIAVLVIRDNQTETFSHHFL